MDFWIKIYDLLKFRGPIAFKERRISMVLGSSSQSAIGGGKVPHLAIPQSRSVASRRPHIPAISQSHSLHSHDLAILQYRKISDLRAQRTILKEFWGKNRSIAQNRQEFGL